MEGTIRMSRKRPINVEISPRFPDEPLERMVKRFIKKMKKQKVLEEVRDRRYYEKPSTKRRKEAIKRKRLVQKNTPKR